MNLKDIQTLAELTAKKYNPEGLAPFPFENIQKDFGDLKILSNSELDTAVSGAIAFEPQNNEFVILVNDQKPSVRQYFTLAHELGHYFLHKNQIQEAPFIDGEAITENISLYRRDGDDRSQLEVEANHFAACLIMPEPLVREVWACLQGVEECARSFKVSVVAMSIRLNKLGLVN